MPPNATPFYYILLELFRQQYQLCRRQRIVSRAEHIFEDIFFAEI